MKFSEICRNSEFLVQNFLKITNDKEGYNDGNGVLLSDTQEKVKESLGVLDEALEKFE